ncbi:MULTISPECIES: DUF305 domain-containing protein [Dietzia]|uniref:DUF305 domain-containing protein n=1 Tax=Dietzia TaxID=37914 RepID=UPI0015C8A054|nr:MULTISPECIES: DUF305 domain-containing protein [Dietzia]MCT1516461.1 DUF305 domain-containing protein [Dietzia cercidiphylli]MDZ4234495.1 DUF305 domain-containing protein [Dietzia sp.]
MTRTTLLIPAALIAAALTLSACTDSTEDTSAAPTTTAGATTSVTDTATSDQEEEHSETDVMFAQMMIPHHQQAIEMSEIILAKDGIPADVTALAEEIKAAQGPEIAQLTDWLEQWGEPTEPQGGHGGHDMSTMDGMLSDDEIQQLSQAQGVDAARMFMEQMIAHHEGAITMAEEEVAGGRYDPAVELAQTIIDTQQQEIDTMRSLLNSL